MTRVLVTGGRHFSDVPFLWEVLDTIDSALCEPGITGIVEGASDDVTGPYNGADYWAHQWAVCRDRETVRLHAKWDAHGKAAGPMRNAEMLVRFPPGLVVAFKGDRGTADMMAKARAASVPTLDLGGDEWKLLPAIGLVGKIVRERMAGLTPAPPDDGGTP